MFHACVQRFGEMDEKILGGELTGPKPTLVGCLSLNDIDLNFSFKLKTFFKIKNQFQKVFFS